MDYGMLAVSVLLAVSNNVIYHRQNGMGKGERFSFTALSSLVWLAILLCGGVSDIQGVEVLFGLAYGIVQALFLFFKMQAMSTGPISITSVVGNCSMLLTTVFGVLLFSEEVGLMQAVGVCILIVSVVLCTDPKADMEMTPKWKLYCALFFIFAALVGILFKLFSRTAGSGNNMMIISSVTMVVLMGLLSFSGTEKRRMNRGRVIWALLAGAVSCGYNRLNLYLSGALPTVIFFPVFNGAVVLLTSLSGAVFFKEKFSKKQFAGIIGGIISIVLIGGIIKI